MRFLGTFISLFILCLTLILLIGCNKSEIKQTTSEQIEDSLINTDTVLSDHLTIGVSDGIHTYMVDTNLYTSVSFEYYGSKSINFDLDNDGEDDISFTEDIDKYMGTIGVECLNPNTELLGSIESDSIFSHIHDSTIIYNPPLTIIFVNNYYSCGRLDTSDTFKHLLQDQFKPNFYYDGDIITVNDSSYHDNQSILFQGSSPTFCEDNSPINDTVINQCSPLGGVKICDQFPDDIISYICFKHTISSSVHLGWIKAKYHYNENRFQIISIAIQ